MDPAAPPAQEPSPVRAAWALYRRRPVTWLLLWLVVAVPELLAIGPNLAPPDNPVLAYQMLAQCIALPLAFLVVPFVHAVAVVAMAREVAGLAPEPLGGALRHVGARLPTLLPYGLLWLVAASVVVTPFFVAALISSRAPEHVGPIMVSPSLTWVSAALSVLAYARFGPSLHQVLLTRAGVEQALRDSWRLTRRRWPAVLGHAALATLPPTAVSALATRLQLSSLGASGAGPLGAAIAADTAAAVFSIGWGPFAAALLLFVWMDLREREGRFGAGTLRREMAGAVGGRAARPAAMPPRPERPGPSDPTDEPPSRRGPARRRRRARPGGVRRQR